MKSNSHKNNFLATRSKKDLVYMAQNLNIRHAKSFTAEKLLSKLKLFSYKKLIIALNS